MSDSVETAWNDPTSDRSLFEYHNDIQLNVQALRAWLNGRNVYDIQLNDFDAAISTSPLSAPLDHSVSPSPLPPPPPQGPPVPPPTPEQDLPLQRRLSRPTSVVVELLDKYNREADVNRAWDWELSHDCWPDFDMAEQLTGEQTKQRRVSRRRDGEVASAEQDIAGDAAARFLLSIEKGRADHRGLRTELEQLKTRLERVQKSERKYVRMLRDDEREVARLNALMDPIPEAQQLRIALHIAPSRSSLQNKNMQFKRAVDLSSSAPNRSVDMREVKHGPHSFSIPPPSIVIKTASATIRPKTHPKKLPQGMAPLMVRTKKHFLLKALSPQIAVPR
eukprot:GHVS01035517.1.p1 GENE.GHVS01035517.1~~GHVS01035517.1.p1  ORF type:complete len:334 (-),score=48.39 GHVS01035517.1:378-1379(-)